MQPNSNNRVGCAVTIRKQLKESKQMENQRQHSNNAPTFDMIPMLMANLLEDNKILSAKIDALNKKINMSMTTKKDDDNERMDVTEAQKYMDGLPTAKYLIIRLASVSISSNPNLTNGSLTGSTSLPATFKRKPKSTWLVIANN